MQRYVEQQTATAAVQEAIVAEGKGQEAATHLSLVVLPATAHSNANQD
jgi:hypothetical protein